MNLWIIFNSLGAVALFLFGMKIMSEGIQRAAGDKLRRFINSMTLNKGRAFLAGILLTAVIQSSSAVSVLTISFVNAGLLKLLSAFSIIAGANIGTTIKLWIFSLGFEIHIADISLSVLALALPFYFLNKTHLKHWATFAIGFALIFMGLDFLQQTLEPLASNKNWFSTLIHSSEHNSLLYVLIGLVLTMIIQSSSASTTLMMVLYSVGFPLESCAMMIIGANIGTTFTAHIAATVGNTYSKRTAAFHTFFNLIGAILFFFTGGMLIRFLNELISDNFLILAAFHTIFNVVTALILFPFLEKITDWFYSFGKKENTTDSLQVMHSAFGVTPELYIYEATKMLGSFAGNIRQTINYLGRMITESDEEKMAELHERLLQLEKEGDHMELEIRTYLNEIFHMELTGESSRKIHYLINVSAELENIGDLAIKTSIIHLTRRQSNSYITPRLRTHLIEIHDVTSSATTHLIQNLNESSIDPALPTATRLEQQINERHDAAFEALLAVAEKNKIKPSSILYFRELIQNYELIGDHIYKAQKALIK